MASFNQSVGRGNAAALMPEEFSDAILERLEYSSAAMRLFSPVKMSRKQTRMPVLASVAMAYFVNGNTGNDTGLIATTTAKWDNKYLNAEELAVIVPFPKAVLDDSEYDVYSRMQNQCEQAIARRSMQPCFSASTSRSAGGRRSSAESIALSLLSDRTRLLPRKSPRVRLLQHLEALLRTSTPHSSSLKTQAFP